MMLKTNFLIDTHVAIFAMCNHNELNREFISILEDLNSKIYISMVSVWEVAIKSIKHPDKIPVNEKEFVKNCGKMEFDFLPIKASHILNIRNLRLKNNISHKDPFDKLLVSQSVCENLTLYTRDTLLLDYDVENVKII